MYINWLTNNNNNSNNTNANYNNSNPNNNLNNNINQNYNNNTFGVNYHNQTDTSSHIKGPLSSLLTEREEINHNSNGNMINNNTNNSIGNNQLSYNIINIVQNCIYRYTSQTSINADIIVEVTHCSTNVRYLAHSTILGMHSGYLRSAIRLDDRIRHPYNTNNRSNTNSIQSNIINRTNHGLSSSNEINRGLSTITVNPSNRCDESVVNIGNNAIVLYLHNVTAEQFSPLLTYMYTGYLDLNCDNIFSVLLATHVLHMPRALEICR